MGLLDKVTLTVIMKARDVNGDLAPRRDRDGYRLTGFVSNDKRGVFGTVLRNSCRLGHRQPPSMELQTRTYGREHPQSLVQRAVLVEV